MKALRISAVNFAVQPALIYQHQATAAYDLVATTQTVVFEDVDPACTSFAVHPDVLPFGLLEDMTVSGGSGGCGVELASAASDVKYSILLSKETGNRQSAWVRLGETIKVVGADMGANDDARHADVTAVWTQCRHDMRFRMMACAAVANVTVLLSGPLSGSSPGALTITFRGANAIPRDVSLEAAVATVAARKPLAFLMGPIPMKKRLSGAVKTMNDAL
jgi:hypothetical protein